MGKHYPCPMIGCQHEFTEEDLAGVASVTCPKCKSVIQLRHAPAPTTPTAPVNAPIVQATSAKRSRDLLLYSGVLGGFLLIVAFGIVAIVIGSRSGKSRVTRTSVFGYRNAEYLFSFDFPTLDWDDHPGMKNRLQVSQFAATNHFPDSRYVALDVTDFKDRSPTPKELDATARQKLARYFSRRFETDPPAGAPVQEGPPVAGQSTHRFAFDGQSADAEFHGEVIFFTYEKFGYWIYCLAPPGFDRQSDLQQILSGFRLTGQRPKQTKPPVEERTFTGKEVLGYQLTDVTGRWQLEDDPKAHDPQADIVLRAMDPMNPKKPTLAADLLVLSLNKDGDAVTLVKKHLQAKQEREGNPQSRIVDLDVGPKDRVGEAEGSVYHWRIDNGGVRDRFAVVGIVPRENDLLVLYGDCPWDRRFAWEAAFEQIIHSLRLTK